MKVQSGTVAECLAARAVLLRQGNLSGRITDSLLRSRPASPSLNGLHGSRAVLLADRLNSSPIQVMAHRILCAGHVQQPGGESPLCNLMEVKHERSARA